MEKSYKKDEVFPIGVVSSKQLKKTKKAAAQRLRQSLLAVDDEALGFGGNNSSLDGSSVGVEAANDLEGKSVRVVVNDVSTVSTNPSPIEGAVVGGHEEVFRAWGGEAFKGGPVVFQAGVGDKGSMGADDLVNPLTSSASNHANLQFTNPSGMLTSKDADFDGRIEDVSSDDGMDDTTQEIPRAKPSSVSRVNNSASSWAGIVRNPNVQQGSGKLSYVPPAIVDGKKIISLSSADFVDKINSCERMLVGSFVGKRLPYTYVKSVLKTLWKPKGEFEMITRGESLLIFKFALDEDRQTALETGCTHIANKLFIIRPWKPFIEQELVNLKSVPIWVKLFNVPFQFWTAKGLSILASYLGNPIMVDAPTLAERRLDFARVCVDVDLSCDFPTSFEVLVDGNKTIQISVEYAWKPIKCNFCGVFGHNESKCPAKPQVVKPVRPTGGHHSTITKFQQPKNGVAGVLKHPAGDGSEWRRVVKGKGELVTTNAPVEADRNLIRSTVPVQILRREKTIDVVSPKNGLASSSKSAIQLHGGNRFSILQTEDLTDDPGDSHCDTEVAHQDVIMGGDEETALGGDKSPQELSHLAQSTKGTPLTS